MYRSQIDYYDNLIKQNPKCSFAGVYSDSGLTGTKASRPKYKAFNNCVSKVNITTNFISKSTKHHKSILISEWYYYSLSCYCSIYVSPKFFIDGIVGAVKE